MHISIISSYAQNVKLNIRKAKFYDISSVFIISHHSMGLGIPYDNKIIVEKTSKGVSRLVG